MKSALSSGSPDIMTVDYEDWFHIAGSAESRTPACEKLAICAEEDTLRVLDLFDRYRARATFFLVGWLAERTPDLIREISRRGHALASHGYMHVPPETMGEEDFRDDLLRSLELIRGIAGVYPRGYRAPAFGVGRCCYPYLHVLRNAGLEYDASVFPGVYPGRRVRRGIAIPHHPIPGDSGFWEIPVSAARICSFHLGFSGGGFLRLLPAWFIRSCERKVRGQGCPVVYYVHPRDLNPHSLMVRTRAWRRWRYYGGRNGLQARLERVLETRPCVSVEEFIDLWRSREPQ